MRDRMAEPGAAGIVPDSEVDAFLGKGAVASLAWGRILLGGFLAAFGIAAVAIYHAGPLGASDGWPSPPEPWIAWAIGLAALALGSLLVIAGLRLRERRRSGRTLALVAEGILTLVSLGAMAWSGDFNILPLILGLHAYLLLRPQTTRLLVNP